MKNTQDEKKRKKPVGLNSFGLNGIPFVTEREPFIWVIWQKLKAISYRFIKL